MPTRPTLIVLGGLPGSGKSTIARILARQMALVYVRVDEIEQALLRHRPGADVGTAGYGVAYAVASANLELGLSVVADSVNPVGPSRAGWAAAGRHAAILTVEIICSDPAVHRCRVEQRTADIAGHALPTWADVVALTYEPWPDVDLVVDTASKTAAEAVSLIANAAAQLG